MMELTKERLQQLAIEDDLVNYPPEQWELNEMARQLLATMEQEPVADILAWSPPNEERTFTITLRHRDILSGPLYAAPQLPHPVVPKITSEELDDELLGELIDFRRVTLDYHVREGNKVQTIMHGVVLRAMLELQERRAAMLQGKADQWIPCSERMPEVGGLYLCYVQDEYEFDISHFCFEYLAAHKKFDSAGINITHWQRLPAAPQQEAN